MHVCLRVQVYSRWSWSQQHLVLQQGLELLMSSEEPLPPAHALLDSWTSQQLLQMQTTATVCHATLLARQNDCSGGADWRPTLSGMSQCQWLNHHLQNWLSLCLHHRLPRTWSLSEPAAACLLLLVFWQHSFRVPQHGGTKGNLSRGLHLCTASTEYTAARNVANQIRLLQVTQNTGEGLCSVQIWGKPRRNGRLRLNQKFPSSKFRIASKHRQQWTVLEITGHIYVSRFPTQTSHCRPVIFSVT